MKKVLIIGGGAAGLSAGIYAALNGYRAVICEKNGAAGGNLTGWDREGYHIDNCIHWLSGTNPATDTYKTWCELGALGGVKAEQGKTLYTVEYGEKSLSLFDDADRLRDEMTALSPADKNEALSLIRAVKAVMGFAGIAGRSHGEKSGILKKITDLPLLYKYYRLTCGELADRFKDPLIKRFLSSFLTRDFGSLALLFVFADFCGKNAGIPRGGSRAMAERMTKRFESLGGTLLLNKEAVKINLSGARAASVSFSDGTVSPADHVIITADPASVFGRMIDIDMPPRLAERYKNEKLKRFSAVQCAFACDEETLPFSGDLILALPPKYAARLRTDDIILRSFPHEKGFSPKGKSLIQSMAFCGESDAKRYIALRNDAETYDKIKKAAAGAVIKVIEQRFPSLCGRLRCVDVWTPATYHRYTGAGMGSFMSFAFSSRYLPSALEAAVPGTENVFLATQWLEAPGGLPIAVKSGKAAVNAVIASEPAEERVITPRRASERKINKI